MKDITSPIQLGLDPIDFGADPPPAESANDSGAGDQAKGPDLSTRRVPWTVASPPPQSRTFVLGNGRDGIFPQGKPSTYAAPGGQFKTSTMFSLGMHVAIGKSFAGLPTTKGAVLIVSCEDDAEECQRRLIALARAEFAPSEHPLLEQRVLAIDLAGVDARITSSRHGASTRTNMADLIVQESQALTLASGVPVALIVVDHARLVMGGDANDSEATTQLMNALTAISVSTGAAVVLLCHSPKSAISTARERDDYGAQDVLGSGAFVDNARCVVVGTTLNDGERKRFALDPDEAKRYLALRVVKSNYSEAGRTLYFRKTPIPGWSVAYPVHVDLQQPVKLHAPPSQGVEQRVLDAIKVDPGRYTAKKLRDFAGKGRRLQASDREVRCALAQLLADGRVRERAPTDAEVTAYGVLKRYSVLEATA